MQKHGNEAIEYAAKHGKLLNKYADPAQGARCGVTVERAREIAREDPGLIWVEDLKTQRRYLIVEEGWAGEWLTREMRMNAIELAQYESCIMSDGPAGVSHILPIAEVAQ
jgi:hypothetical protein